MNIDFASFQSVFQWVSQHSYAFVFLAMCVEGPMTTAAAGFAAALGFFNPWVIFILSVAGDLVPDSAYYFLGHKSRLSSIEKMMHKIGLTQARVARLENLLRNNFRKTLLGMKFMPFIGPWGYMLIGYFRLSFSSFILVCSAVTIPKVIVFLTVGYYFGHLYNINEYIHNISFFAPLIVAAIFVLYFIYKVISRIISKKVGKI